MNKSKQEDIALVSEAKPRTASFAYFCTGSCGAQITQEQYDKGLTQCGAKSCNFYGKPFKKIAKE